MICEFCAKESIELNNCRNCDLLICSDCQTPYTQFNQIDYDCCLDCGLNDDYNCYKSLRKTILYNRKVKLRKLKSPTEK